VDIRRLLSRSGVAKWLYLYRFGYFKPYAMSVAETRTIVKLVWGWLKTILFFDQMIRYRCDRVGRNIVFQGTFPLISNRGRIEIGDHVTFVGRDNLIVGFDIKAIDHPLLTIGSHVTIGYGNEINVARHVVIGDHVRIATGVSIFDNNSHPVDPERRRANVKMELQDTAPVIIQDDVWIGMNTLILKGVVIGEGAVVAAGSVVTKDVPPRTVVAGNPARVVKTLKESMGPTARDDENPL
jgi:acetyltransferase-like isoleucine patch superfamily enzyme